MKRGLFFCVPFFEGGRGFLKLKYFRTAGGAVMRVKVTMACTECKQRNYDTMKNKKNDPDRLEMKKYCRFCKKHTLHRETK
jgi:large subunit ribosomal protein L33